MSAASVDPTMNECYLLHLSQPFGHAKHYLGVTTNLAKRLKLHATGRGANMLKHAREVQGKAFGFTLARTWDIPDGYTPREWEIHLKATGGRSKLCPVCKAEKAGRN